MPAGKRLLILRLSAMGDVAMIVPILLALKRTYPNVELFMLSRKRFFPILQQINGIYLIEADVDGVHKGILGLRKLSKQLQDLKPDMVADLHNVLRTKIIRLLITGVKKSVIDKGRNERKKLVKNPKFFKPLRTTIDRYADVLEKLELPLALSSSDLLPKLSIPQKVSELVGQQQMRWVGLAPFAAHESKSLTVSKAKELVDQLSQLKDIQIILFGGGAIECRQLEIIAGTNSRVFNLAGVMSFEDELAMISNLDAMVSVDTGNGHLAAVYGVPVITLWGNTHPYAGFTPYLQPEENQVTVNRSRFPLVPTSIYGNKTPKGYEKVMDTIDCITVMERLQLALR